MADSPFTPDHAAILRHIAESRIGTPDDMLGAADAIEARDAEIERLHVEKAAMRAEIVALQAMLAAWEARHG